MPTDQEVHATHVFFRYTYFTMQRLPRATDCPGLYACFRSGRARLEGPTESELKEAGVHDADAWGQEGWAPGPSRAAHLVAAHLAFARITQKSAGPALAERLRQCVPAWPRPPFRVTLPVTLPALRRGWLELPPAVRALAHPPSSSSPRASGSFGDSMQNCGEMILGAAPAYVLQLPARHRRGMVDSLLQNKTCQAMTCGERQTIRRSLLEGV